MIQIKIIRKTHLGGHPVTLRFDENTLSDIGRLVSGGILDNIRSQRQADGTSLKANAPSTREAKRKMGLPALSLVFKQHRFVKGLSQSWAAVVDLARNRVSVRPATMELANLSRSLQQRGYTGWFGVSERARAAIIERVRRFIKKAIKEATARQRTERR